MNRLVGGISVYCDSQSPDDPSPESNGILNNEITRSFFIFHGILEPHYLLQEKMMDFVAESLKDADAVLYLTDLSKHMAI